MLYGLEEATKRFSLIVRRMFECAGKAYWWRFLSAMHEARGAARVLATRTSMYQQHGKILFFDDQLFSLFFAYFHFSALFWQFSNPNFSMAFFNLFVRKGGKKLFSLMLMMVRTGEKAIAKPRV